MGTAARDKKQRLFTARRSCVRVDGGAPRAQAPSPLVWTSGRDEGALAPVEERQPVLWAVSERVEHAAAGRLAHNVGATPVAHTEGKEWLRQGPTGDVDWPTEFHRAVCETLVFFGNDEANAGQPRPVE